MSKQSQTKIFIYLKLVEIFYRLKIYMNNLIYKI